MVFEAKMLALLEGGGLPLEAVTRDAPIKVGLPPEDLVTGLGKETVAQARVSYTRFSTHPSWARTWQLAAQARDTICSRNPVSLDIRPRRPGLLSHGI